MKKIILVLLVSIVVVKVQAQRIIKDHLVDDVSFLASDKLNGRATGTQDELVAAKYIASKFEANHLKPLGNKGYYYDFKYKYNPKVHDTSTTGILEKRGRNVLGFLDNQAAYTIVIGAHYDHCGLGYDHNSLDANPQGKIHNGADDNASGVAGVIELARYFSTNGIKEKYNFLFMTFSGEELGLIGSKKWCEKPTMPLSNINCMINMDMIGRLNDTTHKLIVYGVGTSSAWKPSLSKVNHSFSIKQDSSGVGPSDQTSFYLKDIPVLHFFTGQHSDYHKPTDDMDKINYVGEASVLELIVDLVMDLNEQPKLSFYKTKSPESTTSSFKVTLGVMPDYAFEGKGLRLDGVTDDKPASKAGLQQGDIIIRMGDSTIETIQDYMKVLGQHKKGDSLEILIQRGSQQMWKTVTF
jgi:Zn-dependent M28 family amino/carboxypeptidase